MPDVAAGLVRIVVMIICKRGGLEGVHWPVVFAAEVSHIRSELAARILPTPIPGDIMPIKLRKLLPGGVVAGVVLILLNVAAQFVLGDRIEREMNAWMPGSVDKVTMSAAIIVAGILMKMLIGIVLVWFYATARARYGAGPRTACYTAIGIWILAAIFFSDFPMMGMMSVQTYALLELLQLVSLITATLVGAKIYSE